MNKALFYSYLHHPELLDDRSLYDIEKILVEYPYFQSARLLQIKNMNNQGSISYDNELKRVAVWVTDRSKLFYLLDKRVLLSVDEYYTTAKQQETTEFENTTIDFSALTNVTTFDSENKLTPSDEDMNDELSQLIMSGSAQASPFFNVGDKVDLEDFVNTFKKKRTTDNLKPKSPVNIEERRKKLIDNFIVDQPRITQKETNFSEQEVIIPSSLKEEPEMITDTLAKIYINQGKYEKAILAYEKLSLKYPEKNIYFAGQIKKIKELSNNQ